MNAYQDFLIRKAVIDAPTGIPSPRGINSNLFDFQQACVKWALQRGRAALFEGTGLGKTAQQCEWARIVEAHVERPVLILAPLAVSHQTVDEAKKILGMQVTFATSQDSVAKRGVYITNYQKLDKFDPSAFGGIVLDESSILKSLDGATKTKLIESFADTPFRLACTATPAPNDYMELGNHAEFLGVMRSSEMLSTFFVHDGGETQKWRLKGHAQKDFWKWMASWAVCIQSPADIGFDGSAYVLPPLRMHEVIVDCDTKPIEGELFAMPARTMDERRKARRSSIDERAKICYELANDPEANRVEEMVCEKQGARKGRTPEMVLREQASNRQVEAERIHGEIREGESRQIRSKHAREGLQKEQFAQSALCLGRGLSDSGEVKGSGVAGQESREAEGAKTEAFRDYVGAIQSTDGEPKSSVCDLPEIQHESEDLPIRGSLPQNGESSGTAMRSMQLRNREVSGQSDSDGMGHPVFAQWVVWCGLNIEQDTLSKMLGKECASIQGSTPDEDKVRLEHEWRVVRSRRVLISKCSVFGHGLNWQHCNKMAFVGLSDSFEAFYQAVRRIWRFGQLEPVDVFIIISSLEGEVLKNIKRKEADAQKMQDALVTHMADLTKRQLTVGGSRTTLEYKPKIKCQLPNFLK